MGRYLDDHEVQRLQSITHLSMTWRRLDDGTLEPDYREALSALASELRTHVLPLSDTRLAGYTILKDLYDRDALVLRVDTTREIYQQGLLTVRYLMAVVVLAGAFFAVVTVLRLERLRALGEMAAGVSRNLNNVLLGIMMPAEILQEQVEGSAAKEQIDAIMFSTTRAAELVSQLNRALPDKTEEEGQQVSVTAAVTRAVESARPRWKDEIEVEVRR
jgi:signal transduction histidine kinase